MNKLSMSMILLIITFFSCEQEINDAIETEIDLNIQQTSSITSLRDCYDEFRPEGWGFDANGCQICGDLSAAPGETITVYGVAYFGGDVTDFDNLNYSIEWVLREGEATISPNVEDPRILEVTLPETFDHIDILLRNVFQDEYIISEVVTIRNAELPIQLNDPGQAGQVFYDKGSLSDNWRYMEFTTTTLISEDFGFDQAWGIQDQVIGNTETTFGTGILNTRNIIDFLLDQSGTSEEPASVLRSLSAWTAQSESRNGFSDWHLPSLEEAETLYQNRTNPNENPDLVPPFFIWTSTEVDADHAFAIDLNSGEVSVEPKNTKHRTIGVRYF